MEQNLTEVILLSSRDYADHILSRFSGQRYLRIIALDIPDETPLTDKILLSSNYIEEQKRSLGGKFKVCFDLASLSGLTTLQNTLKTILANLSCFRTTFQIDLYMLDRKNQLSDEGNKLLKKLGVQVIYQEQLIFGNITSSSETPSPSQQQEGSEGDVGVKEQATQEKFFEKIEKPEHTPFTTTQQQEPVASVDFSDFFEEEGDDDEDDSDTPAPNPFADLFLEPSFDTDDYENDESPQTGDVESYFEEDESPQKGDVPELSRAEISELKGGYGGTLTSADIQRLVSLTEPNFDYSQMQGTGKKGLFGTKGKSTYGQALPSQLATSSYIANQESKYGYYSLSSQTQIISCFSTSGGVGTSTISSMLAIQLNYYFNRDLMMRVSSSVKTRILILSMDEFDDLPVKGIGYTNPLAGENDGKNVFALKQRIDEVGVEDIVWEDIADYFVMSPENFVFYLPQRTIRERIETGVDMTADDYHNIFNVLVRFFQFIIVDTPSTLYTQSNRTMELLFNISDLFIFVEEPNTKSTVGLFRLIDAWKDENDQFVLDPNKCLLVVNKYIQPGTDDNPYQAYLPRHPQIAYKDIVQSLCHIFGWSVAIPLTEYTSFGNILFGTDPNLKKAAAKLADTVLEIIDEGPETEK